MSAPGEQPQFQELLQQAIEENEILRDRVTELEALLVAAEDEIDKRDQAIQELLALTASKTQHNDDLRNNTNQTSSVIDRFEQLTHLGQDNDVEDINNNGKKNDVKGQSKNHNIKPFQGDIVQDSVDVSNGRDIINITGRNHHQHSISFQNSFNTSNNYSNIHSQLSQDNHSEQSSHGGNSNNHNSQYNNDKTDSQSFKIDVMNCSQLTEGQNLLMSQQEQSQGKWNGKETGNKHGRSKEQDEEKDREQEEDEQDVDNNSGQEDEEPQNQNQNNKQQVEEDQDEEEEDKQLNFANIKKRIHKLKK